MNFERIYLDYAATTPLRSDVARAMEHAGCDFNPSSLHAEGRQARALLDDARDRAAAALHAARSDIIFTSGGTEADNLALLGIVRALSRPVHVVASAIEHHAVLAALDLLRDEGVETSLVGVDACGRVDPAAFEAALRPHTALASIMYANNEVGTVQPIPELAAIAHNRGVLFHTDAVAAGAWLPIDVRELGVDLLSLSAHKIYGPKGAGLLYARRGVPLAGLAAGGGQESGRRAGTENLTGIVGLAWALELATAERRSACARVAALRDRFEAEISRQVPGVLVNGGGAVRLPNNSNLSFAGIEASDLLVALDLAGIAASAGSACTSGALAPSHVLAAMAPESARPRGGIRFSLGRTTSEAQIDRSIAKVTLTVAALRDRCEAGISGGNG